MVIQRYQPLQSSAVVVVVAAAAAAAAAPAALESTPNRTCTHEHK